MPDERRARGGEAEPGGEGERRADAGVVPLREEPGEPRPRAAGRTASGPPSPERRAAGDQRPSRREQRHRASVDAAGEPVARIVARDVEREQADGDAGAEIASATALRRMRPIVPCPGAPPLGAHLRSSAPRSRPPPTPFAGPSLASRARQGGTRRCARLRTARSLWSLSRSSPRRPPTLPTSSAHSSSTPPTRSRTAASRRTCHPPHFHQPRLLEPGAEHQLHP